MHCNVPKIDEWHLFAALAIIKMICCSTFWVQTINQIFAHLLDDLMQCRVTIGLSFWYLHWWLNFRNPRVRTATRMRKSMRGHRISIMSLIWNPWAKWKYYSNRHKVECQLDHFHNIPNCSISNQKKRFTKVPFFKVSPTPDESLSYVFKIHWWTFLIDIFCWMCPKKDGLNQRVWA